MKAIKITLNPTLHADLEKECRVIASAGDSSLTLPLLATQLIESALADRRMDRLERGLSL